MYAAIVEVAAELKAERELLMVTLSETAERAGVGRATLYEYLGDVASILEAWHGARRPTGRTA